MSFLSCQLPCLEQVCSLCFPSPSPHFPLSSTSCFFSIHFLYLSFICVLSLSSVPLFCACFFCFLFHSVLFVFYLFLSSCLLLRFTSSCPVILLSFIFLHLLCQFHLTLRPHPLLFFFCLLSFLVLLPSLYFVLLLPVLSFFCLSFFCLVILLSCHSSVLSFFCPLSSHVFSANSTSPFVHTHFPGNHTPSPSPPPGV